MRFFKSTVLREPNYKGDLNCQVAFFFIINEYARRIVVSYQTSLPIQLHLSSRLARSEHPLGAKKPTDKPLCTLKKLESSQTISRLNAVDKNLFQVSLLRCDALLWCVENSVEVFLKDEV